jgi:hypothetical protein
MRKSLVLAVLLFASSARADNGLEEVTSSHDVKETVSRFEAALARAKVAVVAKIDHAALGSTCRSGRWSGMMGRDECR